MKKKALRNKKKGAISFERIVVSSVITAVAGVTIAAGVNTGKDVGTDANTKLENKSEEVVALGETPTGPTQPEKPVEPEKPTIDETKASLDVSLSTNNSKAGYTIGGANIVYGMPHETIAKTPEFNKGRTEFLFRGQDLRENMWGDGFGHTNGFNSRIVYKNGNNVSFDNSKVTNTLVLSSDEYSERNVNEIAAFFKDNAGTLKPNSSQELRFSLLGSEGLSFKKAQVGPVTLNSDQLATLNASRGNTVTLSTEIFNNIQPVFNDRPGNAGPELASSEEYRVFNAKTKKIETKALNEYLGPRFHESRSKSRSFAIEYKVPVRVETDGGTVYSYNMTFEYNTQVHYDFGDKENEDKATVIVK